MRDYERDRQISTDIGIHVGLVVDPAFKLARFAAILVDRAFKLARFAASLVLASCICKRLSVSMSAMVLVNSTSALPCSGCYILECVFTSI